MNVSISILLKKVWNPYRLHITFLSPWRCKYRNPFSCLFIYESDSRELPHRRHNNSYNNKGSFLGEFWGIQCYESRLLQLDSDLAAMQVEMFFMHERNVTVNIHISNRWISSELINSDTRRKYFLPLAFFKISMQHTYWIM